MSAEVVESRLTSPASVAVIAGAVPLYGMCNNSMPAFLANISAKKWGNDPAAAEAKSPRLGSFFTSATYSCSVATGTLMPVAKAISNVLICVTGTKSVSGLNAAARIECGCSIVPSGDIKSVLPSGGAAFTNSAPASPPPPARFSMMMGRSKVARMPSAMARVIVSEVAPGGKPTMMRNGVCADTNGVANANTSPKNTARKWNFITQPRSRRCLNSGRSRLWFTERRAHDRGRIQF